MSVFSVAVYAEKAPEAKNTGIEVLLPSLPSPKCRSGPRERTSSPLRT